MMIISLAREKLKQIKNWLSLLVCARSRDPRKGCCVSHTYKALRLMQKTLQIAEF